MTEKLVTPRPVTPDEKHPPERGGPGKVLVAVGSLRAGGTEAMAVALANALAAEGIDVYFASAGGALRATLDRRVPFLQTDDPRQAPSRVTHELLLYMKHHRFDVVHVLGESSALPAALAARASHLKPVRVFTYHSPVFRRAPRWISGPVTRRCADHFIAINQAKQRELESLGVDAANVTLIPGFVDVDTIAMQVASFERGAVLHTLSIPEGARVLMMSGRVVAQRRFENFIRIAAEVARRQPDREVHALLAGEGPGLEEVRKVAVREAAPAIVHFLGYQKDVLSYLAACDVVVYPSAEDDVLPTFLIQACAAGRPIVCSDLPTHREIVTDGETGRVISGGISDYASAVIELLEHPEQGTVYAHAAQQRALRQFDARAVAHEVVHVYRKLLADRKA